jgi:hypothetical protein
MPKVIFASLVAMMLSISTLAEGVFAASPWRCRTHPVEACFRHRGRLSSQNGIALQVWLIGTTRRVAVLNTEIPSLLEKYLQMDSEDHSYIFGDFEICPLEPDTPGHMRSVCVSDAKNLVVQNLRQTSPPFRLLSTWPKGQTKN